MIFDILNVAFVLAEDIDNKWLWPTTDRTYQLLQIFVGIYRQNGAEDLFLHHKAVFGWLFDNRWRKVQFIFNDVSSI